MNRVTRRALFACVLSAIAVFLHVSLCEWVRAKRLPYAPQTFEYYNRVIVAKSHEPVAGGPAAPGQRRQANLSAVAYTGLITESSVSLAEGVVFGVATPAALVLIAAGAIMPLRRLHRLDRGRCPACGYDLRFDAANGCSECGWRVRQWPEA
jgi:hypothetical protein